MLLTKEKFENGCSIGIWKLEENISELLSLLQNAAVYTEQLTHFSNEKRKREWLAARILTNTLCDANKTICYNDNGRPFITDHSFQISISHSKNNVAVIVHPQKEVGIDIEQINEKVKGLQHKFLSEKETLFIDKQNITNHLLLHWCAKEVLYKMINQEGVDFSEHLHISPCKIQKTGTFFGQETKSERKENYIFEYRIEKDFILVWSVK